MELEKKQNLKGIPVEALEEMLESQGHPRFRARQIFRWINQCRETNFERMTDLSKKFREELREKYRIPRIEVVQEQHSSDGTIKYLVGLEDGERVESVFIPGNSTSGSDTYKNTRNTLCVSTQVGCKMACRFCATGYQKFTRNLAAWEIVDQLLSLSFPDRITNIVLMGMGEPFDNYPEILKALAIFQSPLGPQIGKRHITVSTVGLVPQISDFVSRNLGKLAISLHGTTDEQRTQIMPINRKYPIEKLMEECRNLRFPGRQRVTFEYILIEGLNDSIEDAKRLIRLVEGIPSKINLLAYNENSFVQFKRPKEEKILQFQTVLLSAGLTTTYRRSRGREIAAACGQLYFSAKNSPVSLLSAS